LKTGMEVKLSYGDKLSLKQSFLVPENIIKERVLRTGDGSHKHSKTVRSKNGLNKNERDVEHFWGFGDNTMNKEDMKNVKILKKTFS
jgi:hypothetical protein